MPLSCVTFMVGTVLVLFLCLLLENKESWFFQTLKQSLISFSRKIKGKQGYNFPKIA